MGCTLDSPPILSCCDANAIDAVHDSLVVGDGSELITFGELISLENFFCYFIAIYTFPSEFLDRELEPT